MKGHAIDTQEAPNKWWAARDARMRAAAQWTHYTQEERTRAERMALGLEIVYSAKGIHINPRQRFITIKIDKPVVKDRKTLALLEQDYVALGVIKVVSAQGIIYRIPKT